MTRPLEMVGPGAPVCEDGVCAVSAEPAESSTMGGATVAQSMPHSERN